MATTERTHGLDLIARSLRLLGVLGEGQTPDGQMAQDALVELKSLQDSHRLNRLLISVVLRTVWSLTINVASYAIGQGATWVYDRPVFLDSVALLPTAGSNSEIPVPLLSAQEYAAVRNKGAASAIPTRGVFYDHAYDINGEQGLITLVETPSVSGLRLALYIPTDTANIQNLSSTYYYLAPGVSRMLKYNLASELADDYPGNWTESKERKAVESLAAIMRVNDQPGVLRGDPFWTGGGRPYDIFRGD